MGNINSNHVTISLLIKQIITLWAMTHFSGKYHAALQTVDFIMH
jgi:hypothetical protein